MCYFYNTTAVLTASNFCPVRPRHFLAHLLLWLISLDPECFSVVSCVRIIFMKEAVKVVEVLDILESYKCSIIRQQFVVVHTHFVSETKASSASSVRRGCLRQDELSYSCFYTQQLCTFTVSLSHPAYVLSTSYVHFEFLKICLLKTSSFRKPPSCSVAHQTFSPCSI
jgi:hypothetical protein